jgi:hypothetical protein
MSLIISAHARTNSMKTLTAVALFLVSTVSGIAPSVAQDKAQGKAHTRKAPSMDKREKAPDIRNMEATRFDCELGKKLIIYSEAGDDQQIALQWNKRVHRMKRMSTTTGAHRFEDTNAGLVWIGIPAKGMLLDSKRGRQLANECKTTAQRNVAEQKF